MLRCIVLRCAVLVRQSRISPRAALAKPLSAALAIGQLDLEVRQPGWRGLGVTRQGSRPG